MCWEAKEHEEVCGNTINWQGRDTIWARTGWREEWEQGGFFVFTFFNPLCLLTACRKAAMPSAKIFLSHTKCWNNLFAFYWLKKKKYFQSGEQKVFRNTSPYSTIEAQTFFILTSYNPTAQNYSTCYRLLAAVSGHSLIKVFLCPELKSQLMNSKLPEACTLSSGAGFAHCSAQALCSAWSCSALELYPAVGGQESQRGPSAHSCPSVQ